MESPQNDKGIKILPDDKGMCTLILGKDDYIQKCKSLLDDAKTYKKLNKDPTQKYKNSK